MVSETLEAHGRRLDALASEIADVAGFCAAAMRLTMRMVEADPVWGGFMVRMGTYLPELGGILGRRLVRALQRGIHSGRFTVADEATALAVVAGVVFGTMHVQLSQVSPDSLPDDADSLVAEQQLPAADPKASQEFSISRRTTP